MRGRWWIAVAVGWAGLVAAFILWGRLDMSGAQRPPPTAASAPASASAAASADEPASVWCDDPAEVTACALLDKFAWRSQENFCVKDCVPEHWQVLDEVVGDGGASRRFLVYVSADEALMCAHCRVLVSMFEFARDGQKWRLGRHELAFTTEGGRGEPQYRLEPLGPSLYALAVETFQGLQGSDDRIVSFYAFAGERVRVIFGARLEQSVGLFLTAPDGETNWTGKLEIVSTDGPYKELRLERDGLCRGKPIRETDRFVFRDDIYRLAESTGGPSPCRDETFSQLPQPPASDTAR